MAVDYTTLLTKLNPDPGGESTLRLRVGTVDLVNANGTLDIEMSSGVIVQGVPKLASAYAPLGAVVQMISLRGSLLVLGAVSVTATDTVSSRISTNIRTSNSSAVTAETVIDSVTASLVAGRTYKVRWDTKFNSTVANDTAFFRLRENNLAGTQLQNVRVFLSSTGTGYPAALEAEFTAVATGNKTFVGTLARASGSGDVSTPASANSPGYLYVDYVRG
jgi:hypothetical protein